MCDTLKTIGDNWVAFAILIGVLGYAIESIVTAWRKR